MKATNQFKQYLNSIINDVDGEIHEELWRNLFNVIVENDIISNYKTMDYIEILKDYEYMLLNSGVITKEINDEDRRDFVIYYLKKHSQSKI